MSGSNGSVATRLRRAWLLTAVSDFLFANVLSVVFYGSTVTRLWQGVASVPFGKRALDGGAVYVGIGIAVHFTVALTWSTVFLVLYSRWEALRTFAASRFGVIKTAAIYGPCIWMVMSLIVIPVLAQRAPAITVRWFIQALGHIVFVATPIVAMIRVPTARPASP